MVEGVEMCVEGKPVMAMATREDGEALLQSYQKTMLPEGEEKIRKCVFSRGCYLPLQADCC